MKRTLAALAVFVSGTVLADMGEHNMGGMGNAPGMSPMGKPPAMQGMEKRERAMPMNQTHADLSDGEVRKVDRDAGKLTLRHGPVPSMGIAAMTMTYSVSDTAFLDDFKAGDKVKFAAQRTGKGYTVVRIEPAE